MNVVLLITITLALTLTLTLTHTNGQNPKHNSQPCQKNTNNKMYKNFVRKHILQRNFDFNSMDAWKSYLEGKGLCDRPTQSFFESKDKRRVLRICNGDGRQLEKNTNYCISDSTMRVHVLRVQPDCTVTRHSSNTTKVVVSCDEINDRCLPVHFKESTNQSPPLHAKVCKP